MSDRPRLSWSNLPLAIGAIVMAAGSLLLLANVVVGVVAPGKKIDLVRRLYGVVEPDGVRLSVANVLDGTYQSAFARRIGTLVPLFSPGVRLRNQIDYSLFGTSATPAIVIGRHQQLLEKRYITDYCSIDLAAFLKGAPAWAARIRHVQDIIERRGQTFLFVVTPSKVAQYPDYLPEGTPCLSDPKDRAALVPAAVAQLKATGVHVVDTTATLRAARGTYPFAFFPRGGTHWNAVGGALASQAVEAALQKLRHDDSFRPFSFVWHLTSQPVGEDVDLGYLSNLIWLPDRFDVPVVTDTQAPRAPDCRPVRIVIIGGSFMIKIGGALSRLPCGAHVVEYEYWSKYRIAFTSGANAVSPGADSAVRDSDLQSADAIIYEENESLLANAKLDVMLEQWLETHEARN